MGWIESQHFGDRSELSTLGFDGFRRWMESVLMDRKPVNGWKVECALMDGVYISSQWMWHAYRWMERKWIESAMMDGNVPMDGCGVHLGGWMENDLMDRKWIESARATMDGNLSMDG